MKDERTTQILQKIYSEMVLIMILLCAVSLVVKVLIFNYGLSQCLVEWFILVGTPLYRAIRAQMLQVTLIPGRRSRKQLVKNTFVSLIVMLAIFGLVAIFRPEAFTTVFIVTFIIPYVGIFILFQVIATKWEEKRAKKLGDQYDE